MVTFDEILVKGIGVIGATSRPLITWCKRSAGGQNKHNARPRHCSAQHKRQGPGGGIFMSLLLDYD